MKAQKRFSLGKREACRARLEASISFTSTSLGFGLHGQESYGQNAVVWTPKDVIDDDGHMIDEIRVFGGVNGKKEISCASVMALKITDSPVVFHSGILVSCLVLTGEGRMVQDNEVVHVSAADVILLPPGVQYGIMSDDPLVPVKVLMMFTPGLAPGAYCDAQIISPMTSQRLGELTEA